MIRSGRSKANPLPVISRIPDENPAQKHAERNESCGPPPLDHLDAAMRVLDPVFLGVTDPDNRLYNVFIKDYKCTRW